MAELGTPCQKKPWICTPRKIEMVAFDADDTIWRITPYGIASGITGPLKKIDEDTVEAEEGPPPAYTYYEPWEVKPIPRPKPSEKKHKPRAWFQWDKPKSVTPKWLKEIPGGSETELTNEQKGALQGLSIDGVAFIEEVKGTEYVSVTMEDGTVFEISREGDLEEIDQWWKTEKVAPKEELEVKAIAEELIESLPEKEQIKLLPPPKAEPAYKGRKLTIKLMPGFRDTLQKLSDKGITKTIISLNTEGSVKRIINAFGLTSHFVDIRDSWKNKADVFREQTDTYKINPCNAIFVDNLQSHVEPIAKQGAIGLVFDKDIKEIAEILGYIENHG